MLTTAQGLLLLKRIFPNYPVLLPCHPTPPLQEIIHEDQMNKAKTKAEPTALALRLANKICDSAGMEREAMAELIDSEIGKV